MSLIDFIEKLQKKPRYVRARTLWLCVIVCMVFIVGIWFATFKSSLSGGSIVGNQESLELLKKTGKEVFSIKESLKANIGSFFDNDSAEDLKELKEKEEEKEQQAEEREIESGLRIIEPAKLPLIQDEE